jgi:hypothetical protein
LGEDGTSAASSTTPSGEAAGSRTGMLSVDTLSPALPLSTSRHSCAVGAPGSRLNGCCSSSVGSWRRGSHGGILYGTQYQHADGEEFGQLARHVLRHCHLPASGIGHPDAPTSLSGHGIYRNMDHPRTILNCRSWVEMVPCRRTTGARFLAKVNERDWVMRPPARGGVVVTTGASSGIGRATAGAFAGKGACGAGATRRGMPPRWRSRPGGADGCPQRGAGARLA